MGNAYETGILLLYVLFQHCCRARLVAAPSGFKKASTVPAATRSEMNTLPGFFLGATLTAFSLGGRFREFGIARGVLKRTEPTMWGNVRGGLPGRRTVRRKNRAKQAEQQWPSRPQSETQECRAYG
jgi:hypothetical protein